MTLAWQMPYGKRSRDTGARTTTRWAKYLGEGTKPAAGGNSRCFFVGNLLETFWNSVTEGRRLEAAGTWGSVPRAGRGRAVRRHAEAGRRDLNSEFGHSADRPLLVMLAEPR